MAKPGAAHEGTVAALEHQLPVGNTDARKFDVAAGNAEDCGATSNTGTASRAGRAASVTDGAAPAAGGSARIGAPGFEAPPLIAAQNGPAPSASGHPTESAPCPPDAATQTRDPAASDASPVAHHPPRRRAISTAVA